MLPIAKRFPSFLFTTLLSLHFSSSSRENPYHHIINLDNEGHFTLKWLVNWTSNSVTFNVTAATRGYLGLGFSSRGRNSQLDLIFGGLSADHLPYLLDMHRAPSKTRPILDSSQDLILHNAWENGTHTSLQFSRRFETSDVPGHDYTFNDDTMDLLWCYGDNDDYKNSPCVQEGTRSLYLLTPDWTPESVEEANRFRRRPSGVELRDLHVWTVTRSQKVADYADTMYWCSFHKGPQLEKKHHLVGFNFRWESDLEYNRTHHLILLRCQAPEGRDPFRYYQPYVEDDKGEMCYFFLRGENGSLPLQTCREVIFPYAIGGQMLFLPEHVGMPFGDNPHEYFLLQVHYDNYDLRSDLEYTVHIDLYYTEHLRPYEGGVASTGHHIPGSPSILLPPGSLEHQIYGHCGSQCTQTMLPPEGINVFAVLQHTHFAGRRHRLRQFRGNMELPWIANDDNYSGNAQKYKTLRDEVRVLPGDHLLTQCTFHTSWALVGGFGAQQHEMCLNYLWYYNRMPDYSLCRSEILELNKYSEKHLGVRNFTWEDSKLEFVVTEPQSLAGLTISEVANRVKWDDRRRRQKLQEDHKWLSQKNFCPSSNEVNAGSEKETVAKYPVGIQVYVPKNNSIPFM